MKRTRIFLVGLVLGLFVVFLQFGSFFYESGLKLVDIWSGVAATVEPQKAHAISQYSVTGGLLQTGTNQALSQTNRGSWRGTVGNDSEVWQVARTTTGLSLLLFFDGVQQRGANKMIITIEDGNVGTGNTYTHLICDWVSSTNVFLPADANCTGGGWRPLSPLQANYTNTSDIGRTYEIYDGYFWTTGNVAISTPLGNFIQGTTGRVMIRTYSTVNSTIQHRTDYAQVEMAIDPVYEPAALTTTNAGTVTNGVRNLIGTPSTNVNASDDQRITIPMSAVNTPLDVFFSFRNIKTYEGMNSVLVSAETCVSAAELTFAYYLFNFTTNAWERGTATTTSSACATDSDFIFAINSSTIPGFDISNYINGSQEMRLRILTSAPTTIRNIQLDRLYLMLGSVNANTAECEISWGSGTATNCSNTRSIGETATGIPVSTWQVTSALEYAAANQHPLDNDDDVTNGEHAFSSNISFPIRLPQRTTVTGIHYAAKFRSNNTSMTLDTTLRTYRGLKGVSGIALGNGWLNTPGTDTNASTAYSYFDTWRITELQNDAPVHINTEKGLMNMRLRTSLSANTTTPTTFDWAFAFMSARWLEDERQITVLGRHAPSSGVRLVGTAVTQDATNLPTWRGAVGNDSTTNGGSNYWTTARTAAGFDKLLYFDDVKPFGANKMIISIEDSNVTTANAYEHLICDWVSGQDAYLPADANCPGGWRSLHPLRSTYTNTADTLRRYEIYDGYFWTTTNTRVATPISNFISSSTRQSLIRLRSTVNSAVQYRVDDATLEMAIDPVYEPANIALNSVGTITNGVRHLIGTNTTGVTGSDAVKLLLPMAAINTPIDVEFTFKNIKSYPGANTIQFMPEICATSATLTFAFYVFNFTTSTWVQGTATTTPSICAGDTNYGFTFNSTTIPGFQLNEYIRRGEFRIALRTASIGTINSIQLDQMYLMLGSVNTDTAECELSFGSGTLANCANTRSMAEGITATPSTATWGITSVLEYQALQHANDNDADAVNAEFAKAANISFPVSIATGTMVTGIHYALKMRTNTTAETWDTQLQNYASLTGLGGELLGGASAGGRWSNTVGFDANNATTYTYYDSYRLVPLLSTPDDFIDYTNNLMNMRLRTSISTNTTAGVTGDWDFAMMSIRYLESREVQSLSFSLSDEVIGFGDLSPSAARYATGDSGGSPTSVPAHQIFVSTNAESGYALSFSGSTLLCCGGQITPLGTSLTASTPGTEQFGISLVSDVGSGVVVPQYAGGGNLFAFGSTFPVVLASGPGSGLQDAYSVYYLANISPVTRAGPYTATLSFIVTATY